jgi:hypothetical protein
MDVPEMDTYPTSNREGENIGNVRAGTNSTQGGSVRAHRLPPLFQVDLTLTPIVTEEANEIECKSRELAGCEDIYISFNLTRSGNINLVIGGRPAWTSLVLIHRGDTHDDVIGRWIADCISTITAVARSSNSHNALVVELIKDEFFVTVRVGAAQAHTNNISTSISAGLGSCNHIRAIEVATVIEYSDNVDLGARRDAYNTFIVVSGCNSAS